ISAGWYANRLAQAGEQPVPVMWMATQRPDHGVELLRQTMTRANALPGLGAVSAPEQCRPGADLTVIPFLPALNGWPEAGRTLGRCHHDHRVSAVRRRQQDHVVEIVAVAAILGPGPAMSRVIRCVKASRGAEEIAIEAMRQAGNDM